MARSTLATFGMLLGERRAGVERTLVLVDCLLVDGIAGVRLVDQGSVEWTMMIMVLAAPPVKGERQLGIRTVSSHPRLAPA